jgi:hypothetical protein
VNGDYSQLPARGLRDAEAEAALARDVMNGCGIITIDVLAGPRRPKPMEPGVLGVMRGQGWQPD